MSKVGVFVPFEGKRDVLASYFERDEVIHFSGIPVADISLSPEATDEEIREVAEDFAYEKFVDSTECVIGETDFLDVFEVNGEVVGWDVDLSVWDRD